MKIIESCITGEGLIKIESREELMELAKMAERTKREIEKSIENMNLKEAKRIRNWRIKGSSWRRVAELAYKNKLCGKEWEPPSNQLAGVALCEKAASIFNEDSKQEPWN